MNDKNSTISFKDKLDHFKTRQTKDLTEEQKELLQKRHEAVKKLPSFRGDVLTKNNIRTLPLVSKGDIYWVGSDQCAYVVADKIGKKITVQKLDTNASISLGITVYEMNKQIVSNEPLFDWKDETAVNNLIENFKHFVITDAPAKYYLGYGRDLHYITLFKVTNNDEFNDRSFGILKETIEAVGDLISADFHVEENKEKSIEVWVRTADSLAELLYIFPYDNGVVELT